MNTYPEAAHLTLQIGAGADATQDELDDLTRQLLGELREMEVESAEMVSAGAAPAGSKVADPALLGAVAVAVLPAVLPKLVEFMQAWALRGQGRTVKFKGKVGGQEMEFEGAAEDLKTLLATLSAPPAAGSKPAQKSG